MARVIPSGLIRCERSLPFKGEVLVRVGERVEPNHILARTISPTEVRVLHVARALSLPEGDLSPYLVKRLGEEVKKGEIIAIKKGLLRRGYPSPCSGRLLAQTGGRLLLAVSPSPLELQSNLRGEVVAVLSDWGAIVETGGILVEGIWGNGVEAFGVMRLVGEGEALDMSYHGAILVCSAGATEEGFKKAHELEVRGVILGSLSSSLEELALSLPFSVVVTEGFGVATMNAPLFSLFQTHVEREISIVFRKSDGKDTIPQVILPHYGAEKVQEEFRVPSLEAQTQVRLTREPYLGQVGRVVDPTCKVRKMESGIEAAGVEIELEGGRRGFVPLTNLEVMRKLAGE